MTRFSPTPRLLGRAGTLATTAVLLAACANDAELDTRSDLAGPEAKTIESFMSPLLIISYVVFFAVLGVTLYSWKNFRIKTDDYEDGDWPEQVHGNEKLELLWTGLPLILFIAIGVFTIFLWTDLNREDVNPITVEVGGESIQWEPEVVVVGQQWWWEYQYHFNPGVDVDQQRVETLPTAEIVTATQMVIPVGQEIELEITSRDVIHSHWIPALNGKRDAVPGRQSAPWKLEADRAGVFFGQCTEFCGLSHSRMRMQVVALDKEDFDIWVAAQMQPVSLSTEDEDFVSALINGDAVQPESSTQRAINTFRTKCSSCHLMEGVADDLWTQERVDQQLVAGAAPNLTHFSSRTTFAGGIRNVWDPETGRFNANDIRIWLQDPSAIKANYTDPVPDEFDDEGNALQRMRGMPNLDLTTQEIDDLVALLESTGPHPAEFTALSEVDIIAETGVE